MASDDGFSLEATTIKASVADSRSPINVDALLDAFEALHFECNITAHKRLPTTEAFLDKYDDVVAQVKARRANKDQYDVLRVIGRGGFGEVQLAKRKGGDEDKVYAIKKLSKCDLFKKKDTAFFWEEREIMALSDSPWVVKMRTAFQDEQYLYLVMDYMAGGDLEALAGEFDVAAEEWAKFYTAELLLAIDALHSMGYAHRDIKPANVLLDAKGHVKLADFGTCVKIPKSGKISSKFAVGTPDYISPEVLESQGGGTYNQTCDFWALGVTLYEMICGDLPFYDNSMAGTYQKIQTHSPEKLTFVDAEETPVDMTDNCKDFIRKLLCHKNDRLGKGGIDEIKGHVWFTGTDFDTLRLKTPPIVPELTSVEDSSQFEDVEPADMPIELFKESRKFEGNHLPFVGFSYGIFDQEGVDQDRTVPYTAERGPTTLAGLAKQVELLQEENSVLNLEVSALKAEQAEQVALKEADEVGSADLSIISQTSMLERSLIEDKDAIKRAQLKAESATEERDMLVMTHAAEVKGLQDQLTIASSDLEHNANKAHKLESRLKESVKEGEQLQQQLDLMSAQLEAEHAEKATLKEANAELETTVLEQKAIVKDHRKKTDRAVRAKDQAELLVDDLREKVRKLERTVNREEEAKLELEDFNSALLKQASELKVKLSASELTSRDLEDECAVLQNQVDLAKKPSGPGDSEAPAVAAEDLATAHVDLKRLREKFIELENSRSTDTAELEARLELEKNGKRELTTKLAQVTDNSDAQHAELASVRSRLSEELENNVDLANELQNGMIEQQDLQAELERKAENLAIAETEFDILTKRLESMDNKNRLLENGIAKLEKELGKHTDSTDYAQMENAKELIDQAQSTITENVAQLLAYEQQISRLALDNERVSAELKLERDEKRKIASTTDSSMSVLKRMSSNQAIGLVAAKQDYEGQIKALEQKVEVMEAERKAIHDQHEADVKYQQQLSRAAVRRQATVKAKDRRTFTDRTNKDLDPETRRIVKQNKQLEQQVQQLAVKVDQALHTNKIDLEALTEEFRAQEEEYREEFRFREEAYTEQIERLKENIDKKSIETQQMRKATNRITQLYDRELELNPSSVSSPPMAMIQKTLKMQCYVEGCLSRPKRGNMKKHGWETFFCSVDNEILKMHLTSDTSTPVETFSIKDMHHVQAVTKEQVIHAKANEVQRIFKLVCVIVSEASKEIYPEHCVHSVLEKDVYHFRGHVFEKSVSKKAELCTLCHKATVGISSMSMLGSGKNRGYQCKFCKKVTHLKHIREDDNGLNDCKGSIELKEILLMADTEEDRERWVSHLSDMIVQRGTTAAIAFKTPAESKSGAGAGDPSTPLRTSPSGLIEAVREARELSNSVE